MLPMWSLTGSQDAQNCRTVGDPLPRPLDRVVHRHS
jgi:hypothetical protein